MKAHSIYLHIPFCHWRCGYCDFNTFAGIEGLIPAYVDAMCTEIECLAKASKEPIPVHTIFFGGGTPSILPVEALQRVTKALRGYFEIHPQVEISLEANPGTLSLPYLVGLRAAGINRLSIGMQSAHPGELRLLEREHDYTQVIQAVKWARQAGFENINLDLIFGLPEQLVTRWQNSLELALGLKPEHFALYALTVEHDTPFGGWARRGLLSMPDPDMAAEMYEWASERLEAESYTQYEISNWAGPHNLDSSELFSNPSLACRHNLQYWNNLPYLGLGAGAHGYAARLRTANVRTPQAYIQRLAEHSANGGSYFPFPHTPATERAIEIDRWTEMGETLMMGLRLTRSGITAHTFQNRFGQSLEFIFGDQIQRLLESGLLEWSGTDEDILRLTKRGRLLGNQVFLEFV